MSRGESRGTIHGTMSRKLLILIVIFGTLIIVLLGIRFVIINRTPKQGVLKITTNAASKVLLENKDLGKTPFEQKVNSGEYSLRIVPEGTDKNLSSWQGNVKIGQNVLTYVNRDLSESELTSAGETLWLEKIGSTKGELTVTSVPDGSQVTIDEDSKGITPVSLTDLSVGDHTLLVSSPGFEPRTIKIKITSGYKLTASLSLALSPGQMLLDNPDDNEATTSPTLAPITSPTKGPSPTPTKLTTPTKTPSPTKGATPTPTKKLTPTPVPTKTTSTTPAKQVQIKDTPTGFLRVRSDASTGASEIGRVKPGEKYAVLDSKTVSGVLWYKITFTETQDGWISGEYATKIE